MGRSILMLLVLSTVTGCAALDMRRGVPAEAADKQQTIGVASLLGDSFNLTLIGTTIFNNKHGESDVNSWHIDARAKDIAMQELAADPRYTVEPFTAEPDPDDEDVFFDAARRAGLDTLLVILPSRYDNQPQFEGGYGLHTRSFLGQANDCPYSLFVIRAYQLEPQKKLGWQWSFSSWTGIDCFDENWPDDLEWHNNLADYTPSQRELLHQAVLKSLKENIPRALENLGFIESDG